MTLLDEIIDAAVDEKVPIGTLLRKCLVLQQQVKNEKFRAWLDRELDGYDQMEELPPYRVFNCVNKGLFIGGGGAMLKDQPIPLDVMEEKDRELIEKVNLIQPAASYEYRPEPSANATVPWHPSLTAKYQTKFFSRPTVLNRGADSFSTAGECTVPEMWPNGSKLGLGRVAHRVDYGDPRGGCCDDGFRGIKPTGPTGNP